MISGNADPEEKAKHRATYRVSLWDLATGTETRQLTGRLTAREVNSGETFKLRFTPDGATVVAFDEDREAGTIPVRRWNAADGKALPDWSFSRPPGDANTPPRRAGRKTLYYVTRLGVRRSTWTRSRVARGRPACRRGHHRLGR